MTPPADPIADEAEGCVTASAFGIRPGTYAHQMLVQAVAGVLLLAERVGGNLDVPTLIAALRITPEAIAAVQAEILREAGGGKIH